MKCFTVENLKVRDVLLLHERESKKTGNMFYAVEVGESGRGRKLTWVACHPTLEPEKVPGRGIGDLPLGNDNEVPGLTRCRVGQTKAGAYILLPKNGQEDNRALLQVYGREGFRGGLRYDWPEPGITIIATGLHAQGAAGRAGGGEEHLLIMEPGTSFQVTRLGRLYGSNSRVRVEWDGDALAVFDPRSEPEDCDLSAVKEV